ncbi:MAG: methyltransferase [Nanoarchaeota archaeon]|nr:methyltransferase [Nanoarchaeota archaeon]
MRLDVWEGLVYEPREDSELLLKHVRENCKGKVLDMGCGSGILGIGAALVGCDVTCADVNPLALNLTKRNCKINNVKTKLVFSDLFKNVHERFDFVVFNPPYLPDADYPARDLTGGVNGNELTINFLEEAKHFLRDGGQVFLNVCSLSSPDETFKRIGELGYSFQVLEELKMPWEKLYVVKLLVQ